MNKLFYVAIILAFVSCRQESSISSPTETKPNLKLKISTDADLSSIQADTRLKVNYEIIDNDTIGATYIVKPKTESAVYHQKIGKDYNILISNGEKHTAFNTGFDNVEELKLKSSKSKGNFYLSILSSGTFRHQYLVEKYKDGKLVGTTTEDFNFSAVKINAYTLSEQIRDSNTSRHSVHHSVYRRYYKFKIDDGSEQYDNYLTNSNDKSHFYEVVYNGSSYKEGDGSISADVEKYFKEPNDNEKSTANVPSNEITELRISQKRIDGTINNIVYKNIPITKK